MARPVKRRHRGQMVAKGLNHWLLRVYLGTDAEGKRRYSSKTFEGTTSQARQKLTEMTRSLDTQSFVAPDKQTTEEYLKDWVKGRIGISDRTRLDYEWLLCRYIYPVLGFRKLQDLTQMEIQRLIVDLSGRVSPRTVEYAFRVFNAGLLNAVKAGLLQRNPGEHVELPKKIRRNKDILTLEQVNTLFEKTKEDTLHSLWVVLLTTGLRPQEALALTWADIDLAGAWLSVNRTVIDDGKGHYRLSDDTKTGDKRTIGLPATTVESLKAYKRSQANVILAAGPAYKRLGLLYTTPRGTPLDISKVRRAWKSALKRCELPVIRLYNARHTHLTHLLANGADLAWVADRAGHSDVNVTRNHYAAVLPETHREMGSIFERALKKANKVG